MYLKNEKAFDTITDDSAYWLGFLSADGSISLPTKKMGGIIRLSLSTKDHVVAFNTFLESEAPVYSRLQKTNFGTFPIHGVNICCSALTRRLDSLGITPDKTHSLIADSSVAFNRHFWRGAVDGDGSVGRNKRGQLVIYLGCASEQFIRQFEAFVKTCVNTKATTTQHKQNGHWRFQLCGKFAEQLVEVLYRDATYRLKA